FSCFAVFFYFQFGQKLLAESAITPRRLAQHFAPDVWRTAYGHAATLCLLLLDLFLKFALTFLIYDLGRLPGFPKQCSRSFGISRPQDISDARLRSCSQSLIRISSRIRRQRKQHRLSIGAAFAQDSLSLRIFLGFVIHSDIFRRICLRRLVRLG